MPRLRRGPQPPVVGSSELPLYGDGSESLPPQSWRRLPLSPHPQTPQRREPVIQGPQTHAPAWCLAP